MERPRPPAGTPLHLAHCSDLVAPQWSFSGSLTDRGQEVPGSRPASVERMALAAPAVYMAFPNVMCSTSEMQATWDPGRSLFLNNNSKSDLIGNAVLDQLPSAANSVELDMWAILFSTNTESLTLSQPINTVNANLKICYTMCYQQKNNIKHKIRPPIEILHETWLFFKRKWDRG